MALFADRGDATRLLLVRHAEPDESARGRCYGRLDIGLSSEGRRRAEALGAALAEPRPAAVYSSPLSRALDTAAAFAAPLGLEPVVDDDLRELDFGELEGLTYDEIRREHGELYREWMERPAEVTFPGGEGLAALRDRVLPAVACVRLRHEGEAAAIVAHGGVIRVVLGDVLGLGDGAVFRLGLDYGGVSVVDWLDAVPIVRAVNTVLYSPA
jgi:broad specificity phosphatase PhoE